MGTLDNHNITVDMLMIAAKRINIHRIKIF